MVEVPPVLIASNSTLISYFYFSINEQNWVEEKEKGTERGAFSNKFFY